MYHTFTPEEWVVVKVTNNDPHYRLLCGWKDGKFKVSDKITEYSCSIDKNMNMFIVSDGDEFHCEQKFYGCGDSIYHVWRAMQEQHPGECELLTDAAKWYEIEWIGQI